MSFFIFIFLIFNFFSFLFFFNFLLIEWSASNKVEFSFSYLIFLENQKISTKKEKSTQKLLYISLINFDHSHIKIQTPFLAPVRHILAKAYKTMIIDDPTNSLHALRAMSRLCPCQHCHSDRRIHPTTFLLLIPSRLQTPHNPWHVFQPGHNMVRIFDLPQVAHNLSQLAKMLSGMFDLKRWARERERERPRSFWDLRSKEDRHRGLDPFGIFDLRRLERERDEGFF